MMDSPVDFYVRVSRSQISSNVYGNCVISVQQAICRQDHKWSRSEGFQRE